MERRISVSINELSRFEILTKVIQKRLTSIKAAKILDLSIRQIKRLKKRLVIEGPKGLIPKKMGAQGNHRLPLEVKDKALRLIAEQYNDFSRLLA